MIKILAASATIAAILIGAPTAASANVYRPGPIVSPPLKGSVHKYVPKPITSPIPVHITWPTHPTFTTQEIRAIAQQ